MGTRAFSETIGRDGPNANLHVANSKLPKALRNKCSGADFPPTSEQLLSPPLEQEPALQSWVVPFVRKHISTQFADVLERMDQTPRVDTTIRNNH